MVGPGIGRGSRIANLKRRLEQLSETSGGRAVFAEDNAALGQAFGDVVADLSHQYVLSFVPSRGTRDGTWRTLKVEIPGKRYRIRARQGYRAREAP